MPIADGTVERDLWHENMEHAHYTTLLIAQGRDMQIAELEGETLYSGMKRVSMLIADSAGKKHAEGGRDLVLWHEKSEHADC